MKNLQSLLVSQILIGLSAIGTILLYISPAVGIFGLNTYFLDTGEYFVFILQLFTSNFLHGDFFHFLFNSVFLYYFGMHLELLIGKNKFIIFFLFTAIFNGICIILIESGAVNTIGISGFCMAMLSYYTLELKSRNNPEWRGGVTALILNVGIGFLPGISLWGHFFGAIAGVIFYFLNKEYFRRKMVGV